MLQVFHYFGKKIWTQSRITDWLDVEVWWQFALALVYVIVYQLFQTHFITLVHGFFILGFSALSDISNSRRG